MSRRHQSTQAPLHTTSGNHMYGLFRLALKNAKTRPWWSTSMHKVQHWQLGTLTIPVSKRHIFIHPPPSSANGNLMTSPQRVPLIFTNILKTWMKPLELVIVTLTVLILYLMKNQMRIKMKDSAAQQKCTNFWCLRTTCHSCSGVATHVIIHAESSTKGSMLICKTMCSSGCICMWSSQTVVQSMPLGNLLLAGESKEKL